MQINLRIRFSSKMLFGDSMLRRAAAASFVSMLSSVPETVVSVHQMTTNSLIRNTRRLMLCIIYFFEKCRSNTGEWLQRFFFYVSFHLRQGEYIFKTFFILRRKTYF